MNLPLVSVCIAVYNREKFIKQAIESVLNQTYQNFEIIVIDDGSIDNTVSVIKSIDDTRIRLYNNSKNKGIVYTRNKYIGLANGDYIAILDSDDLWVPEKLEKQLLFLKQNPDYGICGTNAIRKYANGKEEIWKYPSSHEAIKVRLFWGSAIIHSSLIIKKSIIKNNNISYSNSLKQAEDFDLIRKIVAVSKAKNINKELVIYNIHKEQITVVENEEQINDALAVVSLYLNSLNISFTEEILNAYKKIFTFKFALSLQELNFVKEFFEKIYKKNKEANFTSNKELCKVFGEKWLLTCYNSTNNGVNTIKIYKQIRKELKLEISLTLKLKFLYKCLLKK